MAAKQQNVNRYLAEKKWCCYVELNLNLKKKILVFCSTLLASRCCFYLHVHECRKFRSVLQKPTQHQQLDWWFTTILVHNHLRWAHVTFSSVVGLWVKSRPLCRKLKLFFLRCLHRCWNANGSFLKCDEAQRICELCPNLFFSFPFFLSKMSF